MIYWLVLAFLTACQPKAGGQSAPAPVVIKPTLESMQKDLVDVNCKSCHTAASVANRWVDLTDLKTSFVGSPPNGQARKIIKPGCPDYSMFYLSIKNDKMPPGGKLTDADKATVKQWVISLKPGENCDDEPPG